jgi:uncharacterized membrane protein (DUF4010 family)
MPTDLYRWFPEEGVKIVLVLFLCFLTGLEREERAKDGGKYRFGGVRTFPLIGLIGYAMAFLSGGQILPVAVGFAVISGFLMLSYRQKMALSEQAGVTTEMSGLTTYLVGALVYHEQFWIATTLSIAGMLLLELKDGLENVSKRIDSVEIFTFTKFLLLTAVILPVLPRQDLGPFQINPFNTWLVVVAVSTVSYGSYVVQKWTRGHGGIMFAAVLGGFYSSTVVTIALSRRARHEARPHVFSAAMLVACGVMYLRIAALLAIFNHALFMILGIPFALLAMAAVGGALLWSRISEPGAEPKREYEPRNPLEMRAALGFALLFVLMMAATRFVSEHLGKTGVYGLAALMGVTDVDPFIMGMTQSAGAAVALKAGAAAILIAAASNNVIKGIYSYFLCDRQTGRQSLVLLVGLAVAGLLPLFWLWL